MYIYIYIGSWEAQLVEQLESRFHLKKSLQVHGVFVFLGANCYGNRVGMRGKTLEGGGLGVVVLCRNKLRRSSE